MKTKFNLILFLLAILVVSACKKETPAPEEETVIKTEQASGTPTEGNIQITGTQNDNVVYDDKTVTVKSFTIDKLFSTVVTGYAQITLNSVDKDGTLPKFSIGINLLSGLPAVGVKTSILSGSTPVLGLNVYQNSGLYSFSAMNGTFTVDNNDGHNATLTFSDFDMKQSFMQGFDASLKRFKVKSFKLKIAF
ncbi:MAG: hypothetical protein EOO91_18745 [Pedobacter sp.]|nr:MAG: hypothetical protein EOO91_18745 [Pedobacter sp.]